MYVNQFEHERSWSDLACSVMFELIGELKDCSFIESQTYQPYCVIHRTAQMEKNVREQLNLKK